MSAAENGALVFPAEFNLALGVIAVIFAIIGSTGNLVSVVSLVHSRTLRTKPATVLVLSLCVSDLLFCLIDLPLYAAHFLLGRWPFGEHACAFFTFSYFSTVSVSLTSISAITVNRYVRISHAPDAYVRLYTPRRLCAMLVLMWGFGPLLMLLPLTGAWGGLGFDPDTGLCSVLTDTQGSPGPVWFLLLAGTLPCGAIIGFCYYKIYRTVRRSERALQAHRLQQPSPASEYRNSLAPPPTDLDKRISSESRSRKSPSPETRKGTGSSRLTRTIFLIVISFTLCFAPHLLVTFIEPHAQLGQAITYVPIWFSSIVNPFIYAASNAQYRQDFLHLVRTLLGRVDYPRVQVSNPSGSNLPPATSRAS